ncbi:hypothetical protein Celaphus_00019335, partial [Cervus elaphus hippelaphus]
MILNKLYLTTQFSFKLNEKVLQVLTKVLLHLVFCGEIFQKSGELSSSSENQCENIRLSSFRY